MDHALLERAQQDFADRNPTSRRHYDEARVHLPGGHTRTVLTHRPYPLTFVAGEGATLTDADGHQYIDMLGDYTAGLLGHSERRVIDAVTTALHTNVSVGGIHPAEAVLARLACERFGLDRVRFTNSGTEANLMAITTAIQATGRRTIMVFHGGYHGGVLYFASGIAPWNAPYDFVVAPYNDLAGTQAVIQRHAGELAAVLIEPMQGSGGCVPADAEFLRGTFAEARAAGAVCIADEVMTSRHGRSGMVHLLGAQADITTFGKYIGGGFSFGGFGGSAELLDQYDTSPEGGRTSVISHAGTFNNNIATMTAGGVVLGQVFTADVAEAHTARGDEFPRHVGRGAGQARAAHLREWLRVDDEPPRPRRGAHRRPRLDGPRRRAAGSRLLRPAAARCVHRGSRDDQRGARPHRRPAGRRARPARRLLDIDHRTGRLIRTSPMGTDLFDMSGKVAVVTGGSRGLGREMVMAFAQRGADVVIASRKLDNCQAVADEVQRPRAPGVAVRLPRRIVVGGRRPGGSGLRRVRTHRRAGEQRRHVAALPVGRCDHRRAVRQGDGRQPEGAVPSLGRGRYPDGGRRRRFDHLRVVGGHRSDPAPMSSSTARRSRASTTSPTASPAPSAPRCG